VSRIVDACTHVGTALVVDEAYWHFLTPRDSFSAITFLDNEGTSSLPMTTPLIVLRCLTKWYALAGLRLGCAIADAGTIARIRRQLPSWNVNSFAQAAGVAALRDQTHYSEALAKLAVQRRDFFYALCTLGVPILPSSTHFCLVDVGDAHRVRQQLLKRHLLVRDCRAYGLPTYIRVATRQRDDCSQLLSALEEVING
jgi:histidinol-phosphate/aromatic aminotransferase/cobyric acid decarboxylase-like protein